MITEYNGLPMPADDPLQFVRGGLFDEYARQTDNMLRKCVELVAEAAVKYAVEKLLHSESLYTPSSTNPKFTITRPGERIAYI